MGNFFIFIFLIILDMPGTRGNPSKKYPQIALSRELYDELRELKFEFKVDSMGEVIDKLLSEHKSRKP
jgi:hypothetical protein